MLASFRAHAKGWIAWAFVILITVPFAFWGIGQYRSLITTNYVAKVNGEKIMPNALQQAYQQVYQQQQATLGDKFDPTPAEEKALKQQTLQQLIETTLLRQQADHDHLVASAADVREQIEEIPQFQANGHFDFQQYRAVLASNGLTVPQFEARVKAGLVRAQLREGLTRSTLITSKEIDSVVALLKEQRRVAWFVLPLDHFKADAIPSDGAVRKYYEAHQKQFSLPASVTISYVRLDQATLERKVTATPEELQDYYDSHQSRYGVPPARKAAEILVKPAAKDSKDWMRARAKAEKLLAKVRQSGDPEQVFAALARKNSDDPVSRRNGGSIGYIGRGQLARNLDRALFGIKKAGGTAGPVRTERGWVLLQLLAERAGHMRPFATVKGKVAKDYKASRAKALYFQLGDKLANDAYEHPDSLGPVAESLGLQVHTVAGVTRDAGTGIATNDKVRAAAFSDSVLKQHQNSAPIKLGEEDAVVLRVTNETPSRVKRLHTVRAAIVAALQRQQAATAARNAAVKALANLRAGSSVAAVARSYHVPAQGPKLISRDASKVAPGLVRALFMLPPAPGNRPRYATTSLADGSEAVYALLGVQPGKMQSLSASEAKAYANEIGELYASQAVKDYIAALRERANVKVINSNIQ